MLAPRPLHVLAFLLPLIVAYEVMAAVYLRRPGLVETIGAARLIERLFETFGAASLHIPSAMLAVILLVWHVLLRDPWVVRVRVLAIMAFESLTWTMPVLVLALLLNIVTQGPALAAFDGGGSADIHELSRGARLTLSLGAGIYEELLFRLIGVTVLHLVFVDILRLKPRLGSALAVIGSGVAFMLYHKVPAEVGPGHTAYFLAFYGLAGSYFGALFLLRGFGIVVATHALYDVLVLVAIQRG